jgi:hypothetical protein
MNKSSTLPIQDKLFCLKKDITKLSRAIAENYSFEYSKARILALNLMSFENSYEFDRWYEKETALVNSAVKSTRRLNCKCETNPKNDEPVYIFGCEPSYILWDRKTGETFTIDELTEVVNEDGLKHNLLFRGRRYALTAFVIYGKAIGIKNQNIALLIVVVRKVSLFTLPRRLISLCINSLKLKMWSVGQVFGVVLPFLMSH